jgi:hypothetical protein
MTVFFAAQNGVASPQRLTGHRRRALNAHISGGPLVTEAIPDIGPHFRVLKVREVRRDERASEYGP